MCPAYGRHNRPNNLHLGPLLNPALTQPTTPSAHAADEEVTAYHLSMEDFYTAQGYLVLRWYEREELVLAHAYVPRPSASSAGENRAHARTAAKSVRGWMRKALRSVPGKLFPYSLRKE
ncbi:hypothetical protein BU23DRAFT_567278 [Bimuria novae-zelandiae CBS 107.79]|uniref:Uncharacterized protein n=1 Tax=Bimuria novae-zelandiae CBS 107.79 TaxID=1447943 RepID=A0A6A5VCP3_9PLEO|nr:hypothetical protein BU23DRAFT_567278 [Bimuria novae-zelandiae CBS 107.79]